MIFARLGWSDGAAPIARTAGTAGLMWRPGFYDDLIKFNAHMADVGFVREAHQNILIHAETMPDLLDKMAAYEPHTPIFRMKAEDL